jgi:hypothetical protein
VRGHRTARAFRPGLGWCSRCWCGWSTEKEPGWTEDVVEARALGLMHEAVPEGADWSVVEQWLNQR